MTITIPSGRTLPLQAKSGGGFESSGLIPSGGSGDITWTGTVSHGSTLTISDAQGRFGVRNEVKPLYVNLGGSKAGSALGRDTGDYFVADAVLSSEQSLGQITQTVKRDFVGSSETGSFGGLPFIFNNVRTPLIQYVERYYDFLNDSAGTNSVGDLNLKPTRWWASGLTLPYALTGYQFGDSADGNIRAYVGGQIVQTAETQPSVYYSNNRPFIGREWQSEEYILEQSSSLGAEDGNLIHIWNGEEVNAFKDNWVTRNSSYPDLMVEAYLDQISDGLGTENVIYFGYQCWDTEYNGVYVGDASTRSACTKLIRQPQATWSPSEVTVQLVQTHVPLSGAYLYFRTGMRSWVSDSGVQI